MRRPRPYNRGRNKLLYAVDDDGQALGVKDMARECEMDIAQAETALKELEERGLLLRKGRRIYLTRKGELDAMRTEGGVQ